MPFCSASAIHLLYICREFGVPLWTRIGLPSGSPAISTHSSRPSPPGTILVCTPLDTASPPVTQSADEPDVADAATSCNVLSVRGITESSSGYAEHVARWERRKRAMSSVSPDATGWAAAVAGLRRSDPRAAGIGRVRLGDGFHYLQASGAEVTDRETTARIRALAIPPAWTDVWISPDPL